MASVSKRGKSYIVRYTYKNEKGESRPGWESYRTEKEARERKSQIELEQKQGEFLIPNTMTVKELFDRWLPIQNTKHRWAPKTYLSNLGQIQDLILVQESWMEQKIGKIAEMIASDRRKKFISLKMD